MDPALAEWSCTQCQRAHGGDPLARACAFCHAPAPFAVPADPRQLAFLSMRIGYPLVAKLDQVSQIPRLLDAEHEFCLSVSFHPRLLAAAMRLGVFPMSINISQVAVSALKLHVARAVMAPPGVVHKNTCKRAKRFEYTINAAWDQAVALIAAHHENNWMCQQLQRALRFIGTHPQEFPQHRVVSWEVWSGDQLAAAEIGFIVGSVYTSMTGGFDRRFSHAGSVQLACTAGWLLQQGVALWDFGMMMDYKRDMGAQLLPRADWLATMARLGSASVPPTLLEGAHARRPCADLVAVARAHTPREDNEMH